MHPSIRTIRIFSRNIQKHQLLIIQRLLTKYLVNFIQLTKRNWNISHVQLSFESSRVTNWKLESEDSLYDFIESIFEDKSDMTIYDFYEEIELNLNFENLYQNLIWTNWDLVSGLIFRKSFYMNYSEFKLRENRYSKTIPKTKGSEVKYSGDGFNGIIRNLTMNMNGNVDDKNCVSITSPSVLKSGLAGQVCSWPWQQRLLPFRFWVNLVAEIWF